VTRDGWGLALAIFMGAVLAAVLVLVAFDPAPAGDKFRPTATTTAVGR